MLFTQRKELEKQYYEWLENCDYEMKDSAYNVITFLDMKNLLKEKDEQNNGV